jgi:hypothetical protein
MWPLLEKLVEQHTRDELRPLLTVLVRAHNHGWGAPGWGIAGCKPEWWHDSISWTVKGVQNYINVKALSRPVIGTTTHHCMLQKWNTQRTCQRHHHPHTVSHHLKHLCEGGFLRHKLHLSL